MAVTCYFPTGTRISVPRGGLTLWVECHPGINGLDLFHYARSQGFAILPGATCSTTGR